jgi:hypothetical protein
VCTAVDSQPVLRCRDSLWLPVAPVSPLSRYLLFSREVDAYRISDCVVLLLSSQTRGAKKWGEDLGKSRGFLNPLNGSLRIIRPPVGTLERATNN